MSVAAQSGVLSFGVQPAKAVTKTAFLAQSIDWYRVRAPRIAVGAIQDQQVFPPETGGPLTPDGSFKQMKMFGGEVDLLPRLEESLGYLLKAAFGYSSTVTGENYAGDPVVGVNTHTFEYDPTNQAYQPWLAVRCLEPGGNSSLNSGDVGFDNKIQSIRLTVPAMGKLAMRLQLMGRDFFFENAAAVNAWTYENDFEDPFSVPDAGNGSFKLAGTEYPITAMQVEILNALSRPQDEMVIGDFSPDDFVALQRVVNINFVYKYNDPVLMRQAFTAQSNGTDWSPLPKLFETAGAVPGLEAHFYSPGYITGTSPFGLHLEAARVTITPAGPLELQAGGIVVQPFQAQILTPAAGEKYFTVKVENGVEY